MTDKIGSIDFAKIFQNISMSWFYTKPILFKLLCLYDLKAEYGIECAFRTNGKTIEYNPEIVADKNLQSVKELLELELCRIMLRHPYRKKPENTDEDKWYKASTITITQKFLERYNLPKNQNIEFYYGELMKQEILENCDSQGGAVTGSGSKDSGKNETEQSSDEDNKEDDKNEESENRNPQNKKDESSDSKNTDKSSSEINQKGPTAYWGENDLSKSAVQDFLKENLSVQMWGNLPGNVEQLLKAEKEDFAYYKTILNYFKASTGNKDRTLTRMRPSRRNGFLQMGSRYKAQPGKILVAIDTSESVPDDCIQKFYGALKSIYLQGIKKIDVIQFDLQLLNKTPEKFSRKAFYKIKGRGGTNYSCVFEFAIKHQFKYDGLIIFTDGYALQPKVKKNISLKVLWMLTEKNGIKPWMNKTGMCGWL